MRPLIFFVHVPKTAGSTVNAILHQELPNGVSHCEAIFGDDVALAKAAESVDWMSGHIDLSTAQRRLAATTDRPIRFFTCLRDPVRQVMSHYNWLIEIYHRGSDFYERHPEQIKEISRTIRSSSNDASSIIENLRRYPGLFRNCQSRVVLGPGLNWNTEVVHRRLCEYESIAPDLDGLGSLMRQILGHDVSTDLRENVSPYHFDVQAFDAKPVQKFLAEWNMDDEMLRAQAMAVCY